MTTVQIAHHDGADHDDGHEMAAVTQQDDSSYRSDSPGATGFIFMGLVAAMLVAIIAGVIIYNYRGKPKQATKKS